MFKLKEKRYFNILCLWYIKQNNVSDPKNINKCNLK